MDDDRLRNHTRNALEVHFRKRRNPRFLLTLIIGVTGFVGFVVSYGLLQTGVAGMGIRYPIAVVASYAIFILLLRLWVDIEREHVNLNHPDVVEGMKSPIYSTSIGGDHGWADMIPLRGANVSGPAFIPVLLVGGIVSFGMVLFTIINGAPAFLAEIYIDIALSGLLYRRLQNISAEHWLGACIRRTWGAFGVAAVLLACIGFSLDQLAPESDSMGKAFQEIWAYTNMKRS